MQAELRSCQLPRYDNCPGDNKIGNSSYTCRGNLKSPINGSTESGFVPYKQNVLLQLTAEKQLNSFSGEFGDRLILYENHQSIFFAKIKLFRQLKCRFFASEL